jgi:hypothetical protein
MGAAARITRIELAEPRALFAELLAGALEELPAPPTPTALAYLIDLLDARVRDPGPVADPQGLPAALLAALVARVDGDARCALVRLRYCGDAALFVAGFFAESLARAPFGVAAACEAGRRAYAALSLALAPHALERTWCWLYEELADRFQDFADLLSEVGERSHLRRPVELPGLYAHFLATGSQRDERRLLAMGALAAGTGGRLPPH